MAPLNRGHLSALRGLGTVALVAVLLVPGCITYYGEDTVEVRVLVTEDVGTHVLKDQQVQVPRGSSVLDALQAVAEVRTAYGGGFVEAIDGKASRYPEADVDWFYHVDGTLQGVGSASKTVEAGDVIVWDRRPWNRTPALGTVLTGLPTWPGHPLQAEPLDPANLTRSLPDQKAFVRAQGNTLVVLDAHGRNAGKVAPPWALVHARGQLDGPPELVVAASGPNATALLDRLATLDPTGAGLVLTPDREVHLPA